MLALNKPRFYYDLYREHLDYLLRSVAISNGHVAQVPHKQI